VWLFVNSNSLLQAPSYHLMLEGMLFLWVLYLIFRKKKHPDVKIKLTQEVSVQQSNFITFPDISEKLKLCSLVCNQGGGANNSSLETKALG